MRSPFELKTPFPQPVPLELVIGFKRPHAASSNVVISKNDAMIIPLYLFMVSIPFCHCRNIKAGKMRPSLVIILPIDDKHYIAIYLDVISFEARIRFSSLNLSLYLF